MAEKGIIKKRKQKPAKPKGKEKDYEEKLKLRKPVTKKTKNYGAVQKDIRYMMAADKGKEKEKKEN